MKVKHLLKDRQPPYYEIAPDQPLQEAVNRMMENHIGSLVVFDEGKMISIVTERDILRAVHEHGPDFDNIRVQDVMAPDLVICDMEDSLDQAMELMFNNKTGHRIRHIPVQNEDSLIGVISIGDIVSALLTETQYENRLLKSYIKKWPEPED